MLKGHMQRCTVSYFPYRLVMGNPGLVHGPDLEVAVHNVQPKTGLNAGRT